MSVAFIKEEAKQALRAGKAEEAAKLYTDAMEASEEKSHILHGNRAECYLRLKRWDEALADATASETLKPDWSKAHYRKAQALAGMEDFAGAYNSYLTCLCCEDTDEEAVSEKLEATEEKAWHLALKAFPTMGRSLVATLPMQPGHTVLNEVPIVYWSRNEADYDPLVVEACKKHGVSAVTGAAGILSIIGGMTRYQSRIVGDMSTPGVDLTNATSIAWINAACDIAASGSEAVESLGKDPYHTTGLLLAVKTNCHHCALMRDGVEYGGLFRLGSKFAHSCSPNIVYQPLKGTVHFTALTLIPQDSLVTFSYRGELDFLARSTLQRQKELYATFMFWCGCDRCKGDDLCRQIKCSCGTEGVRTWRGAYSAPGSDCPHTAGWRCDACGRTFTDEQMPLEEEARLEALVIELEDTKAKYAALKEALLQVLDTLGSRHWTFGALCKRLCMYFRGMAKANNSVSAVQMAIAFGAHYLRFLSHTRLYADSPLVCTFHTSCQRK